MNVQETLAVLKDFRAWLYVMPDQEMPPGFKKLRQLLFKSEYKKRQQAQRSEADEQEDCSTCESKPVGRMQ